MFLAFSIWKSSAHPSRIFDRHLVAHATIASPPRRMLRVREVLGQLEYLRRSVGLGKFCSTCLDKYIQELGSTMSRILLDPTPSLLVLVAQILLSRIFGSKALCFASGSRQRRAFLPTRSFVFGVVLSRGGFVPLEDLLFAVAIRVPIERLLCPASAPLYQPSKA